MSNRGIPTTTWLRTVLYHLLQTLQFAFQQQEPLIIAIIIAAFLLLLPLLHTNQILEFGHIVGGIIEYGMTGQSIASGPSRFLIKAFHGFG
jgi:hypothetical protein